MHRPVDKMAEAFQDELAKIKIARLKQAAKKQGTGVLVPMLAGAAGFEYLRRANQDRKLGRSVRQQQQSY